ncbi:MAG: MFS transporter [Promethearchaeota archaeon]
MDTKISRTTPASPPTSPPAKPFVESDSLKKIKRNNRRGFYIFNVLQGFTLSLMGTLLQPYIYSIVESETIVGLITTLAQILMFVPQFWTGKLSDKYGRKIIMASGYLFIITGIVVMNFLPSVLWIEAGILIFYFGSGLNEPAYTNFMNENRPKGHSASNFGVMFFLYFGGSVLANGLIDYLGSEYGYQFYFQMVIIIALIQLVLMMLTLRERELRQSRRSNIAYVHQTEKVDENHDLKKPMKTIIRENPLIRNLIIYLTFDGFVWGLALATYNAGLLANFPMGKEDIARMALVFSIGNLLFQIPAGKLVEKIGSGKSLIISAAMGFGLFGSIIIAFILRDGSFFGWLLLSQIFFAVSVSTYIPAQFSMVTGFSEHRSAEIYGVIMAIKGLGFIPTGIIGGYLMESVHFLLPIIICLLALPIEIIFLKKKIVPQP